MEIRIRTLIPTIYFLLNLCGIYAMDCEESGSTPRKRRGRPCTAPEPQRVRADTVDAVRSFRVTPRSHARIDSTGGTHEETIDHIGHDIKVLLDAQGNVVQAEYPGHNCPAGASEFKHKNFIFRLVILDDGKRFVECIDQSGKLMGVRAWKKSVQRSMEPTESQWFINYNKTKFRVRIDPKTRAPLQISLALQSETASPEGHFADVVKFSDFEFDLYTGGPYGYVTGAAIRPKPSSPSRVQLLKLF